MSRQPNRDAFTSIVAHIGAVDVVTTVMVGVLLIALGPVDTATYVALTIARQVALLARLPSATAAVRDWQRAPSDIHLLERASEVIESMGARLSWTAAIGWAAMFGVMLVLGLTSRAIGGPESLACLLLTLATTVGTIAVLRQVLERAMLEVRLELGEARLRHRLAPPRTSSSFVREQVFVNLANSLAILLGLSGAMMYERAKRLRVESLAEQSERVMATATQLRAGLLQPDELPGGGELDGLELVGLERLPEQLGVDPSSSFDLLEPHAVVDVTQELTIAAAPVGDGRWVLAVVEVDQQLGWVFLLLVVFVGGSSLISAFAGASAYRVLTMPLTQLDEATRRMATQGDVRAISRVTPLRNDELGALANNFNAMLDLLDQLAHAATAVASGDLRVEIRGTGDLPDALRGMLGRLNEVVEQIRSTSLELASASAEIHAITREQEQASEGQSQRVLAVTETIATLAQSAQDISETSAEVLDNAERALSTTDAMIDKINLLNAQVGNVRILLGLIHEIADRSDLLALNGSLEAVRAGEAGRTFALVAVEMRRLAERVSGTIGEVREHIANIEAAGVGTVQATVDSRRLAKGTATAAHLISTVTKRQSVDTEDVSQKMYEVAEAMIATVAAAKQTLGAADCLRIQAVELERLTGQFVLRGSPAPPPANPGSTDS